MWLWFRFFRSQGDVSEEEEEWLPEPRAPKRQSKVEPKVNKPPAKKVTKPRNPKPDASGKPAAKRTRAPRAKKTAAAGPAEGSSVWEGSSGTREAVKVKEEVRAAHCMVYMYAYGLRPKFQWNMEKISIKRWQQIPNHSILGGVQVSVSLCDTHKSSDKLCNWKCNNDSK